MWPSLNWNTNCKEVVKLSDRGTNNSPNTRNPDRPAGNPARLDQFADDIFESKKDEQDNGVTSRKEKEKWLK